MDAEKRKIYSFDVFDTCLARLCGDPHNLFEVLSLRLQALMGDNCTELMRQQFIGIRINCGGCSLHEIYRQVADLFPLPCSIDEMVQMELDAENDMLVPIVATRKLVEESRGKGDVLFISDMYLPDDFIRSQLVRHGFFQEGDRLYVSDSLGAWKHDGTLFRLIAEREGVPFRRWHHYGDHRKSDFRVPRRMGIHAHLLRYDYLCYEEKWRNLPVLQFQFGSIAAGVSRAVRLQCDVDKGQKAFVSDISAPFMLAWVLYIMQDAREKGIRRLYFCARDTLSEYHIARELAGWFPSLEVRYLFMSRISLYEDSLAMDYLRSVGFGDDVPAAIVDTCTSGKTLQYLNALLASHQYGEVFGYFLIKTVDRANEINPYADYAFFNAYHNTLSDRRIKRISGMRMFFELLFSLNYHHKTIGYEYHGQVIRPILRKDDEDEWGIERLGVRKAKNNNDLLIKAFAQAYSKTGLYRHAGDLFNRVAVPTMVDFVDRPRKAYLAYLHDFTWWGKPFVGRCGGGKKGVWSRGNRAYALPSWMVDVYYSMIGNIKLRRKLNEMLG